MIFIKRLVWGIVLGVLVVFAAVGIFSTLKKSPPSQPPSVAVAPTTSSPTTQAIIPNTTAPSTPTSPEAPPLTTPPETLTEKPVVLENTLTGDTATPNTQNTGINASANAPVTPIASAPPSQVPLPTPTPQQPASTQQNTTQPYALNSAPLTDSTEIPQPALITGKLQMVLVDADNPSAKPKGNFIVRDNQNVQVAMQQDSDVAIFELPPGTYQASVSINGKRNTRSVEIVANQTRQENFSLPPAPPANSITPPAPTIVEGVLQVVVKAAGSNQPLKANVYVQKLNGVHVASKNYTSDTEFLLEPGTYRVTVKAKDRINLVQELRVNADKASRATFNLQTMTTSEPVLKPASPPPTTTTINVAPNAPIITKPVQPQLPQSLPNLVETMPERSKPMMESESEVIIQPSGEAGSVVDSIQMPNEYNADYGNAVEASMMGSLELRAVSGVDGQPIAVNFTVMDRNGQMIEQFRNAAFAELVLPAQVVLVAIQYREMNGQERIRVRAGAPTVYTFTITPNAYNQELTN